MVEDNNVLRTWLLKPWAIVFLILLVFLVISGTTSLVIYHQYAEEKSHAVASDMVVARLLADLVLEHEKAAIGLLQSYASRPALIEAVKKKDVAAIHPRLASLKKGNDEIDLVFVTDRDGTVWVNFPVFPEAIGKNLSERDWYTGVSSHWQPYVSRVFKLIVADKPLAVAVVVPVVDHQGDVVGILGSSMRLAFIADTIKEIPRLFYTNLTLMDQAGNVIFSSSMPSSQEITPYPFFSSVKNALSSGKDRIEIEDPIAKGTISATVAGLTGIGWVVVAERTVHDILTAGYRQFAVTSTTSLLLFIIISLFLLYIRKRSLLSETKKLLVTERRLREEQERFKELFDHMGSAVAVYEVRNGGEDFIFKDFNAAAEKIEAVPKEALIGKSVLEVFPGVKDFGLFAVFQRVYRTGQPEHFPAALYKDQRISGWKENYVCKLPTDEIVAIYDDVTERKAAQEQIHASHQQLLDIIEFLPDPTFVIDKEKKIIAWNKAVEELTGVKKEDMLGKGDYAYAISFYGTKRPILVDLIFDSAPEIDEKYGFLKREGQTVYGEGFVPMAYGGKGASFWGVASPLFDRNGCITGAIESVRDITDKKNTEEALRRSEAKYRSIFENVVEGIFQTTPDGRFLMANPVLARIYGYASPEELIGTVTDVSRQLYANPAERLEFLRIIREKGIVTGFELQLKRKDGSVFWGSINARSVYDENGNLLYYEGTVEDITSRKQAEEELKQTLEKLRKSLLGTIQAMSLTVETRDPYTAGHQRRVSTLARTIAQEMNISNDMIDTISMAASIHDIGKMSIPAEILSKPGILTAIERRLIEVHPQTGYDVLKDVELFSPIAEIVLQHHERLDGSGYPQALKDGQILLEAQIIAVADVVEAISTHRPYRPAFGIDMALDEIEKNRGILYNAEVVGVCLKLFREKGFGFE